MEEAFYITPAETQRALGLVCTGYGYASHKTNACVRRTLNCYAAVWVSQGRGWLETSSTRQPLAISEGTLFWLFPGITHSYSPSETGWTEHWVLFEGKLALDFEQAGLLTRSLPVKTITGFAAITGFFDQIKADFEKAGPQTAVLSGMLVGRLIAEINSLENQTPGDDNSPVTLVTQTIGWLEEHPGEVIDFEKISLQKGVGYSTFRRYFKKISGLPPQEYLQNLRISRAKKLLVFSDQSIKQIASAVGFSDPYYFSRVFHNEVGLAPSDFRLQQQLGTAGVATPEASGPD
jgi:AraC family transcriptional regulator of arabinose operon